MPNAIVPTETKSLPRISSPLDACDEAARRINVVIRLLSEHSCSEDIHSPESGHGYDLSMMRNALEAIRDSLLASAEQDRTERRRAREVQ
jgi:hypothetical protein